MRIHLFIVSAGFAFVASTQGVLAENEAGADKPWLSGLPPLPEIQPVTKKQIDLSIMRGVDFLISSQNKNGSWGSATMTKGLMDSM